MATQRFDGTLQFRIVPELQNLPRITLSKVNDLQGNLKTLHHKDADKIAANIHTKGFKYPLYVWFDAKGKAWFLDVHQRNRVIPEWWGDVELPYIEVSAKQKRQGAAHQSKTSGQNNDRAILI